MGRQGGMPPQAGLFEQAHGFSYRERPAWQDAFVSGNAIQLLPVESSPAAGHLQPTALLFRHAGGK